MCSLHKAVTQADGSEQHTLVHCGQRGELLGETRLHANENSQSQSIVWLEMRPVVASDSTARNREADTRISWLHSPLWQPIEAI